MKRVGISLVLISLVLSASHGFAQLVTVAKSAKNIANLNKAIERAVKCHWSSSGANAHNGNSCHA